MIETEHSTWRRVWFGFRIPSGRIWNLQLFRVCTICKRVEIYIPEKNHWYPFFQDLGEER